MSFADAILRAHPKLADGGTSEYLTQLSKPSDPHLPGEQFRIPISSSFEVWSAARVHRPSVGSKVELRAQGNREGQNDFFIQ